MSAGFDGLRSDPALQAAAIRSLLDGWGTAYADTRTLIRELPPGPIRDRLVHDAAEQVHAVRLGGRELALRDAAVLQARALALRDLARGAFEAIVVRPLRSHVERVSGTTAVLVASEHLIVPELDWEGSVQIFAIGGGR